MPTMCKYSDICTDIRHNIVQMLSEHYFSLLVSLEPLEKLLGLKCNSSQLEYLGHHHGRQGRDQDLVSGGYNVAA